MVKWSVKAREITRWNRGLKSKSRWPTKRFRAIGRSLSLSADPLIDLFDLTAGGGGEGLRNDRRIHSRATLSFIYRGGSGNTHRYWNRKRNEGKLLVACSLQPADENRWRRLNSWPRVIVEWILRRRSSISRVSSRFHSLLSIFSLSFFFFDQIRLNWTTFLSLSLFFFSRPSLFLKQIAPSILSLSVCCFSRDEKGKVLLHGVSVVRTAGWMNSRFLWTRRIDL